MNLTLSSPGGGSRDITGLMASWTWSGDKSAISRQLSGEIAYVEDSGLPVPVLGDQVELKFGASTVKVEVLVVADNVGKADAAAMYREIL